MCGCVLAEKGWTGKRSHESGYMEMEANAYLLQQVSACAPDPGRLVFAVPSLDAGTLG